MSTAGNELSKNWYDLKNNQFKPNTIFDETFCIITDLYPEI